MNRDQLHKKIDSFNDELINLRRHIHEHPELSGLENRLSVPSLNMIFFCSSVKFLFKRDLVAALITTIDPFNFGGGGWLISTYFKPAGFVRVFGYFSFFYAIKNKIYISTIFIAENVFYM